MVFRSTECNCKTILHVYFLTMQANHDDLTTSWNQVLNSEVLAWSSENAFRCQPHFALSCNKYYKMGVKNILARLGGHFGVHQTNSSEFFKQSVVITEGCFERISYWLYYFDSLKTTRLSNHDCAKSKKSP